MKLQATSQWGPWGLRKTESKKKIIIIFKKNYQKNTWVFREYTYHRPTYCVCLGCCATLRNPQLLCAAMAYGWERSTPEKSREMFCAFRNRWAKWSSLAMPNVALDGDSYRKPTISNHVYPFLEFSRLFSWCDGGSGPWPSLSVLSFCQLIWCDKGNTHGFLACTSYSSNQPHAVLESIWPIICGISVAYPDSLHTACK